MDVGSIKEILINLDFYYKSLWCNERKLFVVEVDMRWGVPAEPTSREVLLACLQEIDR